MAADVLLAEKAAPLAGDEKEKEIMRLKALGARIGITRRDGEPVTPPKGYPDDWKLYGDPANWGWPVDKERYQSALAYFNGGKGKDKYSQQEWAVLGRRIARLAGAVTDVKYKYDPKEKRVDNLEAKKMDPNKLKDMAAQARTLLETAGEGGDNAKDALAQAASIMDVMVDTASMAGESKPVDPSGVAPQTPNVPAPPSATATPSTPSTLSTPSMPESTPGKTTPLKPGVVLLRIGHALGHVDVLVVPEIDFCYGIGVVIGLPSDNPARIEYVHHK
jgi:hypothetical protein